METLKFKTTIKCGACVATVTPHLEKVAGIDHWEVDLKNPNRILTVETNGATKEDVVNAITEAGYKAEQV
jgi:copper chaperone